MRGIAVLRGRVPPVSWVCLNSDKLIRVDPRHACVEWTPGRHAWSGPQACMRGVDPKQAYVEWIPGRQAWSGPQAGMRGVDPRQACVEWTPGMHAWSGMQKNHQSGDMTNTRLFVQSPPTYTPENQDQWRTNARQSNA